MRSLSALLILLAIFLLPACSALQIISNTSPSDHYQKTASISYAEGARRKLDYYVPLNVSEDAPMVVFFYGGGWRKGEREKYEFVASALTDAGFRVVIPDYRLYPEVAFPEFMLDAAQAVAWAHDKQSLVVSSEPKIYLMGHSAGAHIAALLATDFSYLERQSLGPDAIAALVGLSGPYDFLPLKSGYLEQVFPESSRSTSQPINFVSGSTPATLLIHGRDDDVVEPGNSERFAEALRAEGVEVSVRLYDGTGHAAVAAALAPRLDFIADTLDDSIGFINKVSRSGNQ